MIIWNFLQTRNEMGSMGLLVADPICHEGDHNPFSSLADFMKNISRSILHLPLIQEDHLSVSSERNVH